MACRICSISPRLPILPLRRKPAKEESHVEASALRSVHIATPLFAAVRRLSMNHLLTLVLIKGWGGKHPNPLMSKRKLCFQFMSCDTPNPGRHTTITGYWEGPDTEDGWGYIEAAVDARP